LPAATRKQEKAYTENVGHTESAEERRKDFNTELTEGPQRERRQREVFSGQRTRRRVKRRVRRGRILGCKSGGKPPHSKLGGHG